MRVVEFLQKILAGSCFYLDKRLHKVLLEASVTLSSCRQLSIFGIGRALGRNSAVKHNIKTIDRLFGNTQLITKSHYIYQDCAMASVSDTAEAIR